MYKKVLKDTKKKNKGMFKLLNNTGEGFKKAIYHYMNRIIRDEEIPKAFSLTWLIASWKKKGKCIVPQPNEVHPNKTIGCETM